MRILRRQENCSAMTRSMILRRGLRWRLRGIKKIYRIWSGPIAILMRGSIHAFRVLTAAKYIKIPQSIGIQPVQFFIKPSVFFIHFFRQCIGRKNFSLLPFFLWQYRVVAVYGRRNNSCTMKSRRSTATADSRETSLISIMSSRRT